MAAGTPLSAKQAVVRVGAITLHRTDWTVEPKTNLSETPSFEFAGYMRRVGNLSECKVTFEGWMDMGANPFDAPQGFTDGATLINVSLYMRGVGSPRWLFAEMIVESVQHKASVGTHHLFSFVAYAQGIFNYPTGNTV